MIASGNGYTEVVKCLIEAKASPDHQEKVNCVSILNCVKLFSTVFSFRRIFLYYFGHLI